MRKFLMKKLVRDSVVRNILSHRGNKVQTRTLGDKEFVKMLKAKLIEEAKELEKASPDKVVDELADIEETISYLTKVLKISIKVIKDAEAKHLKKAGLFNQRTFIETVELANDDEWISYYEERFPEIK